MGFNRSRVKSKELKAGHKKRIFVKILKEHGALNVITVKKK